jgi:4-hydroxymandelate oxidase
VHGTSSYGYQQLAGNSFVQHNLSTSSRLDARRRLLRFMLQSPLITSGAALASMWPATGLARPELAIPDSARHTLDVLQMKAAARAKLDLRAWHFIVNGADDGKTMAENRRVFDDWQIRVRRLIDISRIDLSVDVLGETLQSPIIIAPVGNQQLVHETGEIGTARGAGQHLMICSTVSSFSIEEIAAQASGPLWFQLYASKHRPFMKALIDNAQRAGCRALVLTIDAPTLGNREGERWFRAIESDAPASMRMGNFENYAGKKNIGDATMTWEIVNWLRANTTMKIVLKGVVTREDARLCQKYGVDGIIVSNHGGRQEESNRATLDCLPEVIEGVNDEIPVLIDGGFRRGTDIFKALGLGARAVCVGRPQVWGLGAFGEDGVSRVMSLLRAELVRIMKFAGTTSVAEIGMEHLQRR